jgi:hypothetical protein
VRPLLVLVVLVLAAGSARAEENVGGAVVERQVALDEPKILLSVPLLGIDRAAVVLQGEYYFTPRLTVLGSLGGRWPDAGDYEARALVAGAGVRWFYFPYHRGGGAFFSARLDLTRRWLIDETDDRSLGEIHALSASVFTGWRLVAWRHLEITPEFGLVSAREWTSTSLPARNQIGAGVGITLGWLF